jgi:hypothetical protein
MTSVAVKASWRVTLGSRVRYELYEYRMHCLVGLCALLCSTVADRKKTVSITTPSVLLPSEIGFDQARRLVGSAAVVALQVVVHLCCDLEALT